jgi:hypothetical protein
MTARPTLLLALCALAATAGCGDDDGPPSSKQVPATAADRTTAGETAPAPAPARGTTLDPEDKRGTALACIRDVKRLDARPIGDKGIQIGPGDEGSRIDFFQSSLEAEGEQFEGRAEGAEQIGAALFYVRETPEEQLIEIEDCLNDQ